LPLTAIFAAGNRAMIKMSENSQRLAVVLMNISPKYFPEDKLKFFDDGMSRIPRATIVRTMTLENPGRLAIGMSGAHIEGASRVGLTPSPTCQTWARWFPARGWGQIGNETGHTNCQPSSDQTHGGIFYV